MLSFKTKYQVVPYSPFCFFASNITSTYTWPRNYRHHIYFAFRVLPMSYSMGLANCFDISWITYTQIMSYGLIIAKFQPYRIVQKYNINTMAATSYSFLCVKLYINMIFLSHAWTNGIVATRSVRLFPYLEVWWRFNVLLHSHRTISRSVEMIIALEIGRFIGHRFREILR